MQKSTTDKTTRIAKNTIFLTGRMLFNLLVALYTSRVMLQALGVEDYGIYGVVGGLVAMFSIISASLQASIVRFVTFELGINDPDRLRRTFSTAFMIQLILAGIVFVLGESIGVWFMNTYMVIPHDRLFAANIVFQASILSFMLGLILMPYYACINAHEHMNIYAYLGILETMLKLAVVLFIAHTTLHFDRLIVYAVSIVGIGVFMQFLSVTYCNRHFNETKVKWKIDKEMLKAMSGFAGWNFIGASSAILRDQGGNILLNIFFGPTVNAARSVANSVSYAVRGFTDNFMAAINPQITKSYAAHETDYMFSLIFRSCRFGYLIMLIIGLPIIFNVHYILYIWLKTVPPDSFIFVRLVLAFTMLEAISSPLVTVQLAHGNIKWYQITVGGLQSLNFPLSFIFLWIGAPAYSIFIIAIGLSGICLIARLFFLRTMIGLNIREFCIKVILRIFITTLASLIIPAIVSLFYAQGSLFFFTSSIICLAATILSSLFLGCDKSERKFILTKALDLKHKFQTA